MANEDSLATTLLVSRIAGGGLRPLKATEFWRLCDDVGAPSALLGRSADTLRDDGLDADLAERIVALLDRATAIAFEVERLDQSGIATLTPFDDAYPRHLVDRLGAKAPPVLHAAGHLQVLDRPGLGLVGARDTADDRDAVASAVECAVRLALPIVCGGTSGTDRPVVDAAHDAGATVVGVLADSLVATVRSPDVRRAIHDGRTVLYTPYAPDVATSAANVRGRDTLIHAQSLATLVIADDAAAADGRSSTAQSAAESLAHGYGRVAVWRGPGEGPGNAALEEQGATPVRSSTDLESALERGAVAHRSPAEQQRDA